MLRKSKYSPGFYPKEVGVTVLDGRRFRLKESLEFVRLNGEYIVVPMGFITDFASVPRALWSLIAPYGKQTLPAIVHDYMYVKGIETKEKADLIFREALKMKGVNVIKRQAMYWAVRMFGKGNFNS